ncbi:MAG: 30S ribosomal protein S10 [Nitrosopumilus sp.]
MTQLARIKLTSIDSSKLESVCTEIRGITDKTGVRMKGPQPLPTKKLRITTRKSPCGQGTKTFDRWEMRVHRRLIDIDPDDRTMKQLMRLKVPEEVYIEVSLI